MTEVVRLHPAAKWRLPDVRELLRGRELLGVLVARDIRIRYRQTLLGAAWALLQPALTTIVLTVLFNRVANVPSQDVPYALFALCGIVPWTFFQTGVTLGSNSLVSGSDMVRKVYFPRLFIPGASVLAGTVDLAISIGLILVALVVYGRAPSLNIVALPVFVVFIVVVALATSCLLAAVNVRYRDVRFAVPFLLQLWLFATPIVYPSTLLKGPWRIIAGVNPLAGVIEGFRWSILGTSPAPGFMLLVSVVSTTVLGLGALLYFGRVERTLADVI